MASTLKRLKPKAEQPESGEGQEATTPGAQAERDRLKETEAKNREFGPDLVRQEGEFFDNEGRYNKIKSSVIETLMEPDAEESNTEDSSERRFVSALQKNEVAKANFLHESRAIAFEAMLNGGAYNPDEPDYDFEADRLEPFFVGQSLEVQESSRRVIRQIAGEVSITENGQVEVPKQDLRELNENEELDTGVSMLHETRDLLDNAVEAIKEKGERSETNREKIRRLEAYYKIIDRLYNREARNAPQITQKIRQEESDRVKIQRLSYQLEKM